MPTYEFYCRDCQKEVTVVMTLKEHEGGSFTCPACKGRNMDPLLSAFHAKTSRKS